MNIAAKIIVQGIAPKLPSRICSFIYNKAGLENSEGVRNSTYIQNLRALKIGENCFINKFCKVLNGFDENNIESYVVIGESVTI